MSGREPMTRRRRMNTLEERLREDPVMSARIDRHLTHLRLEQQMIEAMDRQRVSAAELARRVSRPPSAISRDLNGGLSKAKLGRLEELAEAVNHDLVVLVLPREPRARHKVLERASHDLSRA
jgi:hypothetical protein